MAVVLAKKGFGYMRISTKVCQYPGCKTSFEGVGSSKYCEEHRDIKYRKIINEHKRSLRTDEENSLIDQPILNINQTIDHKYTTATKVQYKCICGEEFEITLFPGVFVYPKYCPKHRNHYQLELLLKRLGIDN